MTKPLRILMTGTVGESIPPPYGGIPKLSLMFARMWKDKGATIGIMFSYHHEKENDLGANAQYFFEYNSKPNKFKKVLFLIRYFLTNPSLYVQLYKIYKREHGLMTREGVLYSAYGVYLDH